MMNSPQNWAPPPPGVAVAPLPHDVNDQLLPALPAMLPQSPAGQLQQPPLYEPAPVAGVEAAPAPAAMEPAPPTAADHKARISDAMKLPDGAGRDAALISALRGVSAELEDAEEDHARSSKRVETARELFDWAAGALSGYSKAKEPKGDEPRSRVRKRRADGEGEAEVNYDVRFVAPDAGPLLPPRAATSGGGMAEEQVAAHRDAFYQKLCGVPYAELNTFTPPVNLVNMKTRAQLDEYIHITLHWDTGTEELDLMEFRRQHKTFYTKMKMSKENIGRRTGHHLRDLAGNEGKKAFCRLGKNDESLMYIGLEELYDAIFEIHCSTGHRGWQACKKIANLKYANIPQDQLKCFVETCPICSSRKGSSPKRQRKLEDDNASHVEYRT